MYNIHSHYETIFHALKSIVTHRRVFYLMPYGSTQPENVESITDNLDDLNAMLWTERRNSTISEGPVLFFYDQEPIIGDYNHPLFDSVGQHYGHKILITTEKDSKPLDDILEKYKWRSVYYFHHAFAAHDWYRGYRYDARLLPTNQRTIKKKFISFNRITSGLRAYRSLLIAELADRNLLNDGYVSFNDTCTEGGDFEENILHLVERKMLDGSAASTAINTIKSLDLPLRIDYKNKEFIPNHSFILSAIDQTQESFCYLVTETCYWEQKKHLTEKIFKPIVSRMPFVLVGPAHNLKYLREYGFKTFSPWIDESYDDIEDPILRMKAIGDTMTKICSYSESELFDMLQEMSPVLEHNYNRFYSNEFIDYCWSELITGLDTAINGS
jgi:hypothetical protein